LGPKAKAKAKANDSVPEATDPHLACTSDALYKYTTTTTTI